jgi:hypothetical protein
MAVISITITASTEEIISGIPRFITLATNIPANIFYSLDGSTPTTSSTIYVGQFPLPTNQTTVVLQVYATNGTDSSPVVSQTYSMDIIGPDLRVPHSGTNAPANSVPQNNIFPFGTPPIQPNQIFTGQGSAGYTTDDPTLPETNTGYDGAGNETGFTNTPLIGIPTQQQPQMYSESDGEGNQGYGIGTIPRHSVAPLNTVAPEQSAYNSVLFDPRAMVIVQDFTQPQDPGLPATINRMSFTTEDAAHTRQGNLFYNTALDAPPATGCFVRSMKNLSNNTITYYYFDNVGNSRWIISTISSAGIPNLTRDYSSQIVPMTNSRGGAVGNGGRNVYKWYFPFGRYLF